MNKHITNVFPPTIVEKESEFCISIYMPTHKTSPENKQDPLRFRNIVDQIESQTKYSKQIKALRELQNDLNFWIYNQNGLAILMNQEDISIYRLARTVEESVHIGERFYLKPLIRNYQSDHRYIALGLAKDKFTLYSGNRYGFRELELDENVTQLSKVLGDQHTGQSLNVVSHGGSVGNFHGHGARSEEEKIDTQKFFTHVDRYVDQHYTSKYKLPLILISLPEHQGLFRSLSQNKRLLENGINKSYESISEKELNKELWQVMEPIYLEKTKELISRYQENLNKGKASHVIQDILKALVQNRVQTLVIEEGKTIPGKINLDTISFVIEEQGEDILNHLSQLALENQAEVVILPKERMPKHQSIFAIYRY